MLTIKKRGVKGRKPRFEKRAQIALRSWWNSAVSRKAAWLLIAALCVLMCACSPPGVRALLKGKKRLEAGRYTDAVVQFETAAELLRTNAPAWNYLGLAYHHSGRPEDAARAYRKALSLDRTLAEAHYNLGSLFLEQNRLEAARLELTAYTLDRQNDAAGFAKLGTVQTGAGDLTGAEKAFQRSLRLATNNPEALTGLGVVSLRRGRGVEASQFFAVALKSDPQYPPALLNYGIVAQEVLKDRTLAAEHFQRYLELKPAAPQAPAVSNLLARIQSSTPASRPLSEAAAKIPVPLTTVTVPRTNKSHLSVQIPGSESAQNASSPQASHSSVRKPEAAREPANDAPVETVTLAPEPEIRAAADMKAQAARVAAKTNQVTGSASSESFRDPNRRGLNLFAGRSNTKPSVAADFNGSAPSSADTQGFPQATAPPSGARYNYLSPGRPAPGNAKQAQRSFQSALKAHREKRFVEATEGYRRALQADPASFASQFNLALALRELGEIKAAARACEAALAIQPNSLEARYQFAVLLKDLGCPVDAVSQLEHLAQRYPREARVRILLGNLYDQQLKNTDKAREHYRQALEADPRHPQAAAIRHWLTDHAR